ncbi:hypothetical protein K7X08_013489 [Anisodus acutangulus]|uniref:Uncharacterized protein n=1 Tax=Anisodus acutangulus TaxID=402998 RepID=A0A9Q1LKE5_9SOLA|nr:hypothetical protein K7X08_013489 [Anisodus acutangulus]
MAYEDSHVSINIDRVKNNKFEMNTNKHSIVDVKRGQKGRAPYGGANILRQPHPKKNSAISTTDAIFRCNQAEAKDKQIRVQIDVRVIKFEQHRLRNVHKMCGEESVEIFSY